VTVALAASPCGPDSIPVEYSIGEAGEKGASLLHVLTHTDTQSHITVCMYACMLRIGFAVWVRGTTAVVFLYYLHAMRSWCINTQYDNVVEVCAMVRQG